jgi:hypothetical protein
VRVDVGEMLGLLDGREAACRAELDRLQAEAERITGLVAVCRQELDRVVTARGVVGELAGARPAAVVPVRQAGPGVPDGEMAAFTERVLTVLAQVGRPVRCRELVEALGQDATVARQVERVRHRLKKLRQAGRVAEPAPGVFTLPEVTGPANG